MSKLSLPFEITLKAIGFEWRLKFERINSEGFTYGHTTLMMQAADQDRLLGSVLFASSYRDLIALADYFHHHINRLIEDLWYESDVFVPSELDFQVQALCGEVASLTDGDFTLRVMFPVDKAPDGSRIYVGIEAGIDVVECYAFVTELRDFLKVWSNSEIL